ncbi:MAG: MurR/RpiR family transcriptional regulator [Clostridiaceae bacterium]|nr:MurR/RpiR family transcriptional regulator [Clostridiaceae bacterium]
MFNSEIVKELNDLELLLYNYVMVNKEKVSYMRIRELADEAHVSTTTILRFCKKLGFEGFTEFKLKLKMYMENENTGKVRDDISVMIDYFKRVSNSDLEEKMNEACDIIGQSNELGFVGIGMSGALCKYASWYFAGLGKSSMLITEPFIKINCNKYVDSTFVVLSVSGETPTTIEHINRLKDANCKIISITNSENCTISKLSDLNIAYYTNREHLEGDSNIDITSQVPVVYILENIAKKLYNKYISK